MKKAGYIVLLLVSVSVLALMATAVQAQVPTACGDCHTKYPSDSFDQYLDGNPVPLANCFACHGNMLNHGGAVYSSPYGYFLSANSLNFANPATLVTIHSVHGAKTMAPDPWGCQNCHAGAACTTCHSPTVPHGDHPVLGDGSTAYPGVRETYAKGTRNQTAPYTYEATLTCTNSSCHGSMNIAFTARPSCLNCHGVDKSGHGDVEALHESDEATAGCVGTGCHYSTNDIFEHENRALTCNTCHNNPDSVRAATLRAAIDANNPRCSACHPIASQPHHDFHLYAAFNPGCQIAGCHTNYLDVEHANRGYRCQVCHNNSDPVRAATCEAAIADHNTSCNACHGLIGELGHHDIHEADPAIDDPSRPYGDFCFACHSNNLMDEHPRHRAADGSYMGCATCHDATSGPVYDAIQSGNTRCDGCHPVHGGIVKIHESPTTQRGNMIDGLECNECHATNLGTIHEDAGVLCSTCHDSPDTTVLAAIDNEDTTCMACHATYHTGAGTLGGTFLLNGGDAYATTLTVSAESSVPGATKARFAIDGVWGSWIDYAAAVQLALPAGEGTRTVRAQYKDPSNNFFDTSDAIVVDTIPPGAPASFLASNGETHAALSWANPAGDFAATRILRSATGYATSPVPAGDQVTVYEGGAEAFSDNGVSAGTDYFYTAFARDAAGNWSVAAESSVRVAAATTLGLGVFSSTPVPYRRSVTLVGNVSTWSGPVPNVTNVELWRSANGVTWTQDGTVPYNAATGNYRVTKVMTANTYFKLEYPGDALYLGSASGSVLVRTYAAIGRPSVPYSIYRGRLFTTWGLLAPRHNGGTKIIFRRYVRRRWVTYAIRWAITRNYGSYTQYYLRYRLPYRGNWGVIVLHSDASHASMSTPLRYMYVR